MDINAMLAQLKQGLELLDQPIQVLARLSADQPRRRGRPPKWLVQRRVEEREKQRSRKPGRRRPDARN